MSIAVLSNPETIYVGKLLLHKTVKAKNGNRDWYRFEGQDMIISFSDEFLAHDPTFSANRVSFTANEKCSSPDEVRQSIENQWTSVIERLPTERRQ